MTSQGKEEGLELLAHYKRQALHYLENAADMLAKDELEKGGEMIWGALAEAIKAVALAKNIHFTRHRDLRRFATQLARELKEEDVESAFIRAERLHFNFYEGGLDPEDVARDLDRVRRVLPRLLALANGNQT